MPAFSEAVNPVRFQLLLDSARRLARAARRGPLPANAYGDWLARHLPSRAELKRQVAASPALAWQPAIDLVIRRRPGDEAALRATQASLMAQTYPRFSVLDSVEHGSGELVGFIDSGDTLAPHALFSIASSGAAHTDLHYCDEDVVGFERPFFKPGWSPDALLSRDYVGGLKLLRRGLLDAPFESEQQLLLRLLPRLRKVHHLSDVLFHRRPDFTPAPSREAVAEHVARNWGPNYRVAADGGIFFEPKTSPRVAVIIPLRDKIELLRGCLLSLERRPSRAGIELIIVDNGSVEPATHAFLAQLAASGRATVLPYPQQFNWSAVNNLGAARSRAEYLLFLNNDVEALTEGWLDAMLAFASRPEIGIVGAQLLYPDGTLQHTGVVMGMTGYAGHMLAGTPPAEWTYCGPTDMIRNCTAVTGACMMMRRALFEELHGFDERFILCGSDVEICLRARKAGYRTVVTPHARLTHFESKTRGREIPKSDFQHSFEAYEPYLRDGDPYYNPQLSLKTPTPAPRLEREDMLSFARRFI